MKRDLFTNLPEELTVDILGRVPSIIRLRYKCVCKSWFDIIEGGKLKTLYTPKPCLGFSSGHMYTVYDDDAREPLFQICLNPPHIDYKNTFRHRVVIDSVDGLLFVKDLRNTIFVVNPMIREYVRLTPLSITSPPCIFGFGVSKISHQYKILCGHEESRSCHVYTLGGGGSWRSIPAPSSPAKCIRSATLCDSAAFFNGNLHWMLAEEHLICCFDLETELFNVFSSPPRVSHIFMFHNYRLCTLEGQLCLCDGKGCYEVVIWRMNSYGDDNTWIKEYTFDLVPPIAPSLGGLVFPLMLLDNGDLLFTMNRDRLYNYSKNTQRAEISNLLQDSNNSYSDITTCTPSFLSLKTMGFQNVQSLQLHPPFFQQPRAMLPPTASSAAPGG